MIACSTPPVLAAVLACIDARLHSHLVQSFTHTSEHASHHSCMASTLMMPALRIHLHACTAHAIAYTCTRRTYECIYAHKTHMHEQCVHAVMDALYAHACTLHLEDMIDAREEH